MNFMKLEFGIFPKELLSRNKMKKIVDLVGDSGHVRFHGIFNFKNVELWDIFAEYFFCLGEWKTLLVLRKVWGKFEEI